MGRVRDRNDAGKALALAHVIDNVDSPRGLHDSDVNAGEATTKLRQKTTHAPFPQAPILRTVGAIDGIRQVVWRRLVTHWRRRSIRHAIATGQLVLANHG